jgi:hypothetical protein
MHLLTVTLQPQDPIETLFCFLGGMVGIIFGLDGWRVLAKKNSTQQFAGGLRIRGFLYALGLCLGTFILDLEKVKVDVSKPRVAMCYAVCLTTATLITVVLVATFTTFGAWLRHRSTPSLYPPASPANFLDTIFFGYIEQDVRYQATCENYRQRTTRDKQAESGKLLESMTSFVEQYTDQIGTMIAAVDGLQSQPNKQWATKVTKDLLSTICGLVDFISPLEDCGHVSANCMLFYDPVTYQHLAKGQDSFIDQPLDTYAGFLVVHACDKGVKGSHLVLPVEKQGEHAMGRLLPGAPRAFFLQQHVVIVDTRAKDLELPTKLPRDVRKKLATYFAQTSFRTLISMNILHKGAIVGILNIEVEQARAFGKTEEESLTYLRYLHPFCILLGSAIKAA